MVGSLQLRALPNIIPPLWPSPDLCRYRSIRELDWYHFDATLLSSLLDDHDENFIQALCYPLLFITFRSRMSIRRSKYVVLFRFDLPVCDCFISLHGVGVFPTF